MKIAASIQRIDLDSDNDVEQIHFEDKEKRITGFIEIPKSNFSFVDADIRAFEIEIRSANLEIEDKDVDRLKIAYNCIFFQLTRKDDITTRHFSAGGFLFRISSKAALDIAAKDEREFKVLVRTLS